jgi:ferredoxin
MRGVFSGLGLTLSHLFRPKVTRLYPYEKRKLPERSRGLIQLIQEEGQATPFNLKCEACLLCEKACPPRAITIEYKPTFRFRKRPYFSPTSIASYYTPRISEYAVDYPLKPVPPVVAMPTAPELEPEIKLSKVDEILADTSLMEAYDLPQLLDRVMDAYGYLPLTAAQRIVQVRGVDLSDLFGIATMSPKFKPAPLAKGARRNDQMERGPSAATRGKYADINHRRAPGV